MLPNQHGQIETCLGTEQYNSDDLRGKQNNHLFCIISEHLVNKVNIKINDIFTNWNKLTVSAERRTVIIILYNIIPTT